MDFCKWEQCPWGRLMRQGSGYVIRWRWPLGPIRHRIPQFYQHFRAISASNPCGFPISLWKSKIHKSSMNPFVFWDNKIPLMSTTMCKGLMLWFFSCWGVATIKRQIYNSIWVSPLCTLQINISSSCHMWSSSDLVAFNTLACLLLDCVDYEGPTSIWRTREHLRCDVPLASFL